MRASLPPLTWFRSFEAAARTLSFTAAAQEIGLTQSAVSQQVKSLEMRLGVALFVRRARGLALTDDGRKLLPQVGAALEALVEAAAPYGTGTADDVLTVAASVSVAQWVIAPRLPRFTARHPDIRIRLISTVWPDDFHASRADVEIRFGSKAQVGQGAQRLEPNGLIAVCAPLQPPDGPADDMPRIETVGTSTGWGAWPRPGAVSRAPTLYTDTYGMALHLAAQGNGVALVTELLAAHALRTGRVRQIPDIRLDSAEGYYLSIDAGKAHAVAFRAWLREVLSPEGS